MSELKCGSVVFAKAGKEKGGFFAVISLDEKNAYIADGRSRLVEKPKKKNLKHISITGTTVNTEELSTNKKLRAFLRRYNNE